MINSKVGKIGWTEQGRHSGAGQNLPTLSHRCRGRAANHLCFREINVVVGTGKGRMGAGRKVSGLCGIPISCLTIQVGDSSKREGKGRAREMTKEDDRVWAPGLLGRGSAGRGGRQERCRSISSRPRALAALCPSSLAGLEQPSAEEAEARG